jgi:hypothetical protein
MTGTVAARAVGEPRDRNRIMMASDKRGARAPYRQAIAAAELHLRLVSMMGRRRAGASRPRRIRACIRGCRNHGQRSPASGRSAALTPAFGLHGATCLDHAARWPSQCPRVRADAVSSSIASWRDFFAPDQRPQAESMRLTASATSLPLTISGGRSRTTLSLAAVRDHLLGAIVDQLAAR